MPALLANGLKLSVGAVSAGTLDATTIAILTPRGRWLLRR